MTVSVTKSGTISGEISGNIEWSSNAIISKAKASVNVKIGASVSIATGQLLPRHQQEQVRPPAVRFVGLQADVEEVHV
jgi:hypothetical protein